jgi:dihydroorotate dehydrogenase (NAD+) catalytic subunit
VRCAEYIQPDPLIVALEINLSCPNITKGGICMGKEAEGVFAIIREVKKVTPIPVIAKLTPEVADIVEIASAAVEAGADGITLINTMPGAAINVQTRSVAFRGGLSGPSLKPIALKAVADVSKAVPVPVVGAGGIMNHLDAIEFFVAGAQAIQVGTATFVHPFAIPDIVTGLSAYMEEHRLSGLRALAGAAHG